MFPVMFIIMICFFIMLFVITRLMSGGGMTSSVSAILANTGQAPNVIAQQFIPTSGNSAYRFTFELTDSSGNMEDPDNNEILVRALQDDGTAVTTELFKTSALSTSLDNPTDTTTFPVASGWRAMERSGVGRYDGFYRVQSSATEETLQYEFGYSESSVAKYISRNAEVMTRGSGVIHYYETPWADTKDITITNGATSPAPNDIVVKNITIGTLVGVTIFIKWRESNDDSGSSNKINGNVAFQVQRSGGSYIDAVDVVDDSIRTGGNLSAAGDMLGGDKDVKAQINATNITIQGKFNGVVADGSNLYLRDFTWQAVYEYTV